MMMSSFSLQELAQALSAKISAEISSESAKLHAQKINTDTRSITQGDVFLALRGENFDGHDYIQQAQEKGATAAIVDEIKRQRPVAPPHFDTQFRLIGVAIFAGVADQIDENLHQTVQIGADHDILLHACAGHGDRVFTAGQGCGHGPVQHILQRPLADVQIPLPVLEHRQIQQVTEAVSAIQSQPACVADFANRHPFVIGLQ